MSGPTLTGVIERATAALETGYTLGTLAIVDERAFQTFAYNLAEAVARQAALALDTAELLAALDELGALEPGRQALAQSWESAELGFDMRAEENSRRRVLTLRGQVQRRLTDQLRAHLEGRLHAAYMEART